MTISRLIMVLFLSLFLMGSMFSLANAGGGTNGLLRRMEAMVTQLERSGEMDAEEAAKTRGQIKTLRGNIKDRVDENGGWINPQHDKDIYTEIDRYNKPLFQRYEQSKAKRSNSPSTLGISPNDKDYPGRNDRKQP